MKLKLLGVNFGRILGLLSRWKRKPAPATNAKAETVAPQRKEPKREKAAPWLLLALAPFAQGTEPAASARVHAGYAAILASKAAYRPVVAVDVDAPVSLGRVSIARVQAKLGINGIESKPIDPSDARTFGSGEFEVAILRRVGSDSDGGASYIGLRGGGAMLRDASGDAP